MTAIFYNTYNFKPKPDFDLDAACARFINLYSIKLRQFKNSFSTLFSFELEIPIAPDTLVHWPKINEATSEYIKEFSKKLQCRVVGTALKNKGRFCSVKIGIETEELSTETTTTIKQLKPLVNKGDYRGDMSDTPLEKLIRATILRHLASADLVSTDIVAELVEIFDDWHHELVKADAERMEAARLEIERRVKLKRKSTSEKAKQADPGKQSRRQAFKLLSPEEQLQRIRAQDRIRQARRYAKIKGLNR